MVIETYQCVLGRQAVVASRTTWSLSVVVDIFIGLGMLDVRYGKFGIVLCTARVKIRMHDLKRV